MSDVPRSMTGSDWYSDLFVSYKTGPYAHITPYDKFQGLIDSSAGLDACWPWEGKTFDNGCGMIYGSFPVRDKNHLAHRLSYVFHFGPFDPDLVVCHECDNPICVNPSHLFLGTQKDNMQDMSRKGRSNPCRGDLSPKSKLTWPLVVEMRARARRGEKQKDLAKAFGVSRKQISVILNEKQWKLDVDTYQRLCMERAVYPNVGRNLMYPLLGLLGESGEIAEKFKKLQRDHGIVSYDALSETQKEELAKELGDVCFYLASLSFELGFSFSEVCRLNIAKLADRKARGTLHGDGDDR